MEQIPVIAIVPLLAKDAVGPATGDSAFNPAAHCFDPKAS